MTYYGITVWDYTAPPGFTAFVWYSTTMRAAQPKEEPRSGECPRCSGTGATGAGEPCCNVNPEIRRMMLPRCRHGYLAAQPKEDLS